MKSAEMAKMSVAIELSNARMLVQQLVPGQLPIYRNNQLLPSPEALKVIQTKQNEADSSISNILNNPDADAHTRAQAFVMRGNLYWELANLPPLPGSTGQPSLQLSESSDALLQKSWDAYQEVIKNSTYADQHEQLDGAHLGLAAIAENRNDWATAQKELEAVENDPSALTVLAAEAKLQIGLLPEMQKKLFLAPPTGNAPVVVGPSAPVVTPTTQFSLPSVMQPVIPATTKP